jgi:hypothetical protein
MDKRWNGKLVACIASGPSLTEADCLLVQNARIPTIAVNTSWKIAKFAEIIYAGDFTWWKRNRLDISIPAERWTNNTQAARMYGINLHRVRRSLNSGLRAIQLAIEFGAKTILLLGFDATVKDGIHWHGEHKETRNPDANRCRVWKNQFRNAEVAGAFHSVEIINCSRVSELENFKKMDLGEALESFSS